MLLKAHDFSSQRAEIDHRSNYGSRYTNNEQCQRGTAHYITKPHRECTYKAEYAQECGTYEYKYRHLTETLYSDPRLIVVVLCVFTTVALMVVHPLRHIVERCTNLRAKLLSRLRCYKHRNRSSDYGTAKGREQT